jgi:hypothetical protein
MTGLSRRDLEAIREIVREEVARAFSADRPRTHPRAQRDMNEDDQVTDARRLGRLHALASRPAIAGEDPEITAHRARMESEHRARVKRAEARAAVTIPNGPFVDLYGARRLLAVTKVTANAWIRRGQLKRIKVDGRLQFSRAEIDAIIAEHKQR